MGRADAGKAPDADPGVNEVRLAGRVSGAVESRELPSGDALVSFRLVVRRPPRPVGTGSTKRSPTIDTIDIACWTARSRTSAARLEDGSAVAVEGSLRRRFYATPGGRASRYEVEARSVRRGRKGSARADISKE